MKIISYDPGYHFGVCKFEFDDGQLRPLDFFHLRSNGQATWHHSRKLTVSPARFKAIYALLSPEEPGCDHFITEMPALFWRPRKGQIWSPRSMAGNATWIGAVGAAMGTKLTLIEARKRSNIPRGTRRIIVKAFDWWRDLNEHELDAAEMVIYWLRSCGNQIGKIDKGD